jgi:hypothetical protein
METKRTYSPPANITNISITLGANIFTATTTDFGLSNTFITNVVFPFKNFLHHFSSFINTIPTNKNTANITSSTFLFILMAI